MKKYLLLAAILFTSACAHGPIYGDEDCDYKRTPRKNYRVQQEVRPQPAPVVRPQVIPCFVAQPVAVQQIQPQPVSQPCNDCQPSVKEVREPVEIVYKKVIYTTTYEPKTTKSVVYEREPVKNVEVKKVKVQQPVQIQQPVIKEVIVEQPVQTVSKVIETQVTQEPVKISIEEVK